MTAAFISLLDRLGTPARRGPSPGTLPSLLGVPLLLWQMVFFVGPLLFLVVVTFWKVRAFRLQPAFSLDNWTRILGASNFHQATLYTLGVAVTATVLALLIAFPAAYIIALRLPARWRNAVVAALLVPVFSSYILRIYAWQIVLSPEGIANSVLGLLGISALPLLGGSLSLHIGLLTLSLPIVVLILSFALSGVDGTLIEAAENMGCNRGQVITRVLLPAIRPALLLAASTTFVLAFGDYVSPLFMTGSNPPTLSILIVDTVKSGSQWPRASVIGVSMLAMLGAALALTRVLASRRCP
ncbi:ABC transporter permease [Diaphorobacter caeni]|uniref:ABC transporter permease n=1 Tax=Diaphorobacter caeni TaxID=2784387 RepID=UPI00188F9E5D|nr:ABC transporter permease [Diaphorobacter caeni]MBF5005807.1 ABC transporter permease [Diaphorobacter caeni]